MGFTIKQATPGDRFWQHVAEHAPQVARWLDDPNDDGNYTCFVATAPDGAFFGLSVVDIGEMGFGPLAELMVGFLEDVLVLPPHRRQGIGTALLRTALNAAWACGASYVRTTVDYDAEALAFYRALGFAFIPEEDPDSQSPQKCYTAVAVNPRAVSGRPS
jgi:GNAT superfamily N-acetyltransferase